MAHIEDRWYKPVRDESGAIIVDRRGKPVLEKTPLFGKGRRYRVRYLNPDGDERSKSFFDKEKRLAEDFMHSIESDKARGTFVDPRSGRVKFRTYSTEWLENQIFDLATYDVVERQLRLHVLPIIGDREISSIKASDISALNKRLQNGGLSESYRNRIHSCISTILNAAIEDDIITKNPCRAKSANKPRITADKIIPWPVDKIASIKRYLPEKHRIMVDLGAKCGMRQGEIFGLGLEDIDFEKEQINIVRQVKILSGKLVFALPKGKKTREVPLPATVAQALKVHLEKFPAEKVSLPWNRPDGDLVTVPLIATNLRGGVMRRHWFNYQIWQPAVERIELEKGRKNGMHALRHFYASSLLDAGESIKTVSEYLGHSSAAFTLRTYTHLMPASEDRAKKAIDLIFIDIESDYTA